MALEFQSSPNQTRPSDPIQGQGTQYSRREKMMKFAGEIKAHALWLFLRNIADWSAGSGRGANRNSVADCKVENSCCQGVERGALLSYCSVFSLHFDIIKLLSGTEALNVGLNNGPSLSNYGTAHNTQQSSCALK